MSASLGVYAGARRLPALLLLAVSAALALLVLTAPSAHAQLMNLQRYGNIVAGIPNIPGSENGPLGTNTLWNAFGMCGGYLSNTVDPNAEMLLIGTARSFRTYNRTTGEVGSWFGGDQSVDVDGPIANASASVVYGCAKYNAANPVIYYVTGGSTIHYVANAVVYSVDIGSDVTLQAVAVYDNRLYVVSLGLQVFRCTISTANPAPQSCTLITLSSTTPIPGTGGATQRGLSVNARGIFIASATALSWFTNPTTTNVAQMIQINTGLNCLDIRTLTASRTGTTTTMFAITSTSVYLITATAANTWNTTLFGGTGQNSMCTSSQDNTDGPDPTFCGLYRVYAESEDELYFSLPSMSIVRSLTLPPVNVSYIFNRRPFPVGFWLGEGATRSEDIMAALLGLMNSNLNGVLGTSDVAVDPRGPRAPYVDPDWWSTHFSIDVPQRDYDVTTTQPTIEAIPFTETLQRLTDYYALTNEDVYTDCNILPTCNITKMNVIQHDIADLARKTLVYPLIYTDPAETVTLNGNPNITKVKLLMPSPFGSAQTGYPYNTTTHPLLEASNFSEAVIEYVRDSYASNPSHVYDLIFSPDSQFPFQHLTDEQLQEVRWLIQQKILERLRECARNSGDPEDGGQGNALAGNPSDIVPGCIPQIGLTNQTYVTTNTDPFRYSTDYTVFIPDTMNYSNIRACLDSPDWREGIGFWIGNSTVTPRNRKCDTGCIIGVAVASAVVACILIVVLVVLVSKRTRLATVVAPGAAGAPPEFASTLNEDDESLGGGENPLDRN